MNRRSFFGAIASVTGALGLAKAAEAEVPPPFVIHGISCRRLTEAELEEVKKAARELAENLKNGGVVALPNHYGISPLRAAYGPWKTMKNARIASNRG